MTPALNLEITGPAAASAAAPRAPRGGAASAAPASAPTAGRAPDHIDFCDSMTFGAAQSHSGLFNCMILHEVICAPRILPVERYDEGGQCMMAMDTLQNVVSEHDTALKPQVARWLTPGASMGAALKSKLCRAVLGLLKKFACPLPLLECDLHTLDSFCDTRGDCLNNAVTFEYGTGTQRTAIVSSNFKAYASDFPSLHDIVKDAASSQAAFQLISDLWVAGCQFRNGTA